MTNCLPEIAFKIGLTVCIGWIGWYWLVYASNKSLKPMSWYSTFVFKIYLSNWLRLYKWICTQRSKILFFSFGTISDITNKQLCQITNLGNRFDTRFCNTPLYSKELVVWFSKNKSVIIQLVWWRVVWHDPQRSRNWRPIDYPILLYPHLLKLMQPATIQLKKILADV